MKLLFTLVDLTGLFFPLLMVWSFLYLVFSSVVQLLLAYWFVHSGLFYYWLQ